MGETDSERHKSTIFRIILASPNDVQQERDALVLIVDDLNRDIGATIGVRLDVWRWETDAHPGFHPEGPQGHIDKLMDIEDSDIVIGIFWKRFGSATQNARSGTEHELRRAWEAWRKNQHPQVMVYFSQMPYSPNSSSELEQWRSVLDFKDSFPAEGLWWRYATLTEFERLVRSHLTRFMISEYLRDKHNDSSEVPHDITRRKGNEQPILDARIFWLTRVQHYQHINRNVPELNVEEAFEGESETDRKLSYLGIEVTNEGLQTAIRLQVSAERISGPIKEGYAERMPLTPDDRRTRTNLRAGTVMTFSPDIAHFSAGSTWRIVFHFEDAHANLWRTEAKVNLWEGQGVIPPIEDGVQYIPGGILRSDLLLSVPTLTKNRPPYLTQW